MTRSAIGWAASPVMLLGAVGCGGGSRPDAARPPSTASTAPAPSPASDAAIRIEPAAGAKPVAPDRPVVVTAAGGRLDKVTVTVSGGAIVAGGISTDGGTWTSTDPLAFGKTHTVKAAATGTNGRPATAESSFTTVTPARTFTATYTPDDRATVGVGMDPVAKTTAVAIDGIVARTLPISAGKNGYETWNGTMVVLDKIPKIDMNSSTVGIFGVESYDIKDVKWDVRPTTSGTYVHAAPWNEGKFGKVDSSHGCVGLSTADAAWYCAQVAPGDVVTVVDSTDTVAANNGFGDWNVPWPQWLSGSATR